MVNTKCCCILTLLFSGLQIIGANVTLNALSGSVAENSSLKLTCTDTGTETIEAFKMSTGNNTQGSFFHDCSVFAKEPDKHLYGYDCPLNRQFNWTILRVTRANENDTWTCSVISQTGTKKANFTISVHVPIQSITMKIPNDSLVYIQENIEAVFVCTTSGGLPAPTVRWYKDKRTSATDDDIEITAKATIFTNKTNDDLFSVTSTLRYFPKKEDNGSKIYCAATNSVNIHTSRRMAQLYVQYSPDDPHIISFVNGTIYKVIEISQGVLSCSITGGNPLPTLSWNCYNTGLDSVTVGATVTKKVTWIASRNNDRSCSCQSSHVTGNTTVSVEVQVLYPPDQPKFKVKDKTVSGPISFIEGTTHDVVCEGNGQPISNSYSWAKGSNTISSEKRHIFHSIKKADDGQYSCKVQNTMIPSVGNKKTGTNTSAVNITVLFAPSSPSLYYGSVNGPQITQNSIHVVKGDTFTIACKSEGQPEPSYRWSAQTSDNQILSVTSISEHNNPKRTCTATNTMIETHGTTEQGSSVSELAFDILYPPSIDSCILNYTSESSVTVSDSVDVIEQSSFSLTCTASSNPSVDSYSWSGPMTSSSASLSLTKISKQQKGAYTLTAKNTMARTFAGTSPGMATKSINFNILYAPVIGQLSNENIEAGSELNVSCPVEKGNPPSTSFIWTRNDTMKWEQQILYIEEVTKHDDMIYTCTVNNKMEPTGTNQQQGFDYGSFHLNVLYRSSITSFFVQGYESSSNVTVNENGDVQMICAVDSNPGSFIKVIYQNSLLYDQNNTKRLVYNHKNASCLDTGVYTCSARNKYNHRTSSVAKLILNVKCFPRPLIPVMENVNSALRTTASLNFIGLAYPVPDPSGFTWKKKDDKDWRTLSNSSTVSIFVSGLNSSLMLKNVSQSDYGQYELIIENDIDAYHQPFHLLPEGVPEIPTEFNPVKIFIRETSAMLQWKPGFDGGPEQTFILMYRKSSDQKWINVTVIDNGKATMNHTLKALTSGTQYTVVIFSRNRVGDSSGSRNTTFHTPVSKDGSNFDALIGGAVGGGVAFAVMIILAVLLVRKFRTGTGRSQKSADMIRGLNGNVDDDSSDDEVITENAMYQSADAVARAPGGNDNVYAKPQKKSTTAVGISDVYAVVNKTKKNDGKKKKKDKSKKSRQGDVYENSPVTKENTYNNSAYDENPYENPELSAAKPKKNVNKDGLIYADLTFNDKPKGQKKLVIHGLDDMTEYVEVDFSKKADPLPDSDTEDNKQ